MNGNKYIRIRNSKSGLYVTVTIKKDEESYALKDIGKLQFLLQEILNSGSLPENLIEEL